jgi:hypothetical protein
MHNLLKRKPEMDTRGLCVVPYMLALLAPINMKGSATILVGEI